MYKASNNPNIWLLSSHSQSQDLFFKFPTNSCTSMSGSTFPFPFLLQFSLIALNKLLIISKCHLLNPAGFLTKKLEKTATHILPKKKLETHVLPPLSVLQISPSREHSQAQVLPQGEVTPRCSWWFSWENYCAQLDYWLFLYFT